MTRDSLAIAIEALSWMAYEGIGERTALFRAAKQLGVEEPDELRQAHRLIMETTRFQNRLDAIIKNAQDNEIRGPPHGIVSFLRILAYLKHVDRAQRRDMLRIVGWGREILGWKGLHPYERSISLLATGTLSPYRNGMSDLDRIAIETCHPLWFVDRIFRHFGRAFALKILHRNLEQMPTYARLNTLATNQAGEIADTIQGVRVPNLDGVWKISKPPRTVGKSNLRPGAIVIQDLASIVAGLVTGVQPDQSVMDICAAPGNKTSHIAALMKNRGAIYSTDISDRRLGHWKAEMIRTGVRIAVPVRGDATTLPIRANVDADVVLVDPPCSNTGVFARNPSIKWTITPTRLNQHIARQRSLLSNAADHVKPDGTLVYCTCSMLPEENEFIIEDFLRRRREFEIVPQSPFLGSPGLRGLEKCQRFYPHIHDCNGYFIAKLRRIS